MLSTGIDEIEAKALKLDPQARTRLAKKLLESLETLSDAENERLWARRLIGAMPSGTQPQILPVQPRTGAAPGRGPKGLSASDLEFQASLAEARTEEAAQHYGQSRARWAAVCKVGGPAD